MKKTILTIIVASSFAFTSCGDKKSGSSTDSKAGTEQTSKDEEEENDSESHLLVDTKTLQNAEEELKNLPKFKGKDIKVFQKIYFYDDGRIIVSLQDPSKPDNIDEYTYQNGKWNEPEAVQISGGGDLNGNLFSLSEIKFETVAKVYKQLEEKAKDIEGAEINTGIYYNLNVLRQEKAWFTGIEGTRGSYSGYFNADGSLKEFKKD